MNAPLFFSVLLSLVCSILSCSKKAEDEASASTKLTLSGSLGVQAQSVELSPPTGTWAVYCEQLNLASNSCEATVDEAGAFEKVCDKLAGVPFQCFLKKSDAIVSTVAFNDQWIVRVPPGTLAVSIAFDTDSSYAKATVAEDSVVEPTLSLSTPSNNSLEGTYTLTCDTNSDGFSDACADSAWYFHRAAKDDPSRYGIWESKDAFDACESEYKPSFKLMFNGESTGLHRMNFDSSSIGEPMLEAAEAFFSAAPSSLGAAAQAAALQRQSDVEHAGFSIDDLSVNTMVELLSLSSAALDAFTTTCTAYDALTSSLQLEVDLATATLCMMSSGNRTAAILWLKNTRAKSCVPKVFIDRVYDKTSASWFPVPMCLGSQRNSACYDKEGQYIGGLVGRHALMRLRSRTGGAVEWSNVDKSTYTIADEVGTSSECQNLSATIMGLKSEGKGEWTGMWSQTVAHGCAEAGYSRPLSALETTTPRFATTAYRIVLTKQ